MIRIMGTYKGRTEEIDTADTAAEARRLVNEYQLAFGPAWVIFTKRGR